MPKYRVPLRRISRVEEIAEVVVEADSPEDAVDVAMEVDDADLAWVQDQRSTENYADPPTWKVELVEED